MNDLFGNESIRALSWKQPFASLMLSGKIETRKWATSYRGKVLICAAQQSYKLTQILVFTGERIFKFIFNHYSEEESHRLKGKAIAIADLVDCRKMTIEDEDKCFVQFKEGLYCHVYKNVQAIKPFPIKGRQGWFKLTDEQKGKIEFKLNNYKP